MIVDTERVIVSMFDDEYCYQRVLCKGERDSTAKSSPEETKQEDLVANILSDKVEHRDHNISLKAMSQSNPPALFEHQPELVHILSCSAVRQR